MIKKCPSCGHFLSTFSSDIKRCPSCGLGVTIALSAVSYTHYHRDDDYRQSENQFRNIFLTRFLLANKFFTRPGRVLDIGCSTGIMLELFKKAGWQVWGIEPSTSSQLAIQKGIKVLHTSFERAKLPKGHFDLIILNHTLEHMEDPVEIIQKIRPILKSRGILFIDVPNFGSLYSKLMGDHWPYLLPNEHHFHFTKKSLENILRNQKFKVIHQVSRSGLFEYSNPFLELWDSSTGFKKRFFTDLIFLPFSTLATYLNAGDSMSFIACRS